MTADTQDDGALRTGNAARPAQHTPGPWDYQPSIPEEGSECFWIGPTDATICIATVDGPQSSQFRWANARLIAAAPDLLEALKKIVDAGSSGDPVKRASLYLSAAAIIAKATGAP